MEEELVEEARQLVVEEELVEEADIDVAVGHGHALEVLVYAVLRHLLHQRNIPSMVSGK